MYDAKFYFSASVMNVVIKDDNKLDTVRKHHTMKAYRGHGGKAQPLKTISSVLKDKTLLIYLFYNLTEDRGECLHSRCDRTKKPNRAGYRTPLV
jgi:hypothetical protein